jgi:hypothetical protein
MSNSKTSPRAIRALASLLASSPTVIHPETDVRIPGAYLEWDGNLAPTAKGARYTLRSESTGARVRDLVIG